MSRKAVCLDSASLHDMDWGPLESFVDLTLHERTPDKYVVSRSRKSPILLVDKVELGEEKLKQLPELEYIGVLATGVDNVNLEAAARQKVTVTHIPAYATESVAQHTFALLLELTNRVESHHQAVRDGSWSASPDFCLLVEPITELNDRALGIVGLGRIGRRVARIGSALGMNIHAAHQPGVDETTVPGVTVDFHPLDELFARMDVVSLHCPLTDQTREMVDAERLETMKPDALLINTARGGLVENTALATALETGSIAGYGADVLDSEPPPEDHPLIGTPNSVLTPHVAWASNEAKKRRIRQAANNLRAYLDGDPINVVS